MSSRGSPTRMPSPKARPSMAKHAVVVAIWSMYGVAYKGRVTGHQGHNGEDGGSDLRHDSVHLRHSPGKGMGFPRSPPGRKYMSMPTRTNTTRRFQ